MSAHTALSLHGAETRQSHVLRSQRQRQEKMHQGLLQNVGYVYGFQGIFNKEQSFLVLLRHDSRDRAEVIVLSNGKMERKSQR